MSIPNDYEQTEQLPVVAPIGATTGFLICLAAETFYFGASFLLRCMTEYSRVSPDWTIVVKESVTVFATLLVIISLVVARRYRFPSFKMIVAMIIGSFFCQFVGARYHLWAFALIGMVLTVPLIQCVMILGVTSLSIPFLGERMTRLKWITTIILIVAVTLLTISQFGLSGAEEETLETGTGVSLHSTLLGIMAAVIAGLGYVIYNVITKRVMRPPTSADVASKPPMPASLMMCLVCGVGMVTSSISLIAQEGVSAFWSVPPICWGIALGAGLTNFLGFCFRAISFRKVSVSKIIFVSSFQIVALAIVGVTVFNEPTTPLLWTGLGLSILGIILAGFSQ